MDNGRHQFLRGRDSTVRLALSVRNAEFWPLQKDTLQDLNWLPKQEAFEKMLGPFATASRRTPPVLHCHSPGVATVVRRLRIDFHNNNDRQRVTEGTAMAPWNNNSAMIFPTRMKFGIITYINSPESVLCRLLKFSVLITQDVYRALSETVVIGVRSFYHRIRKYQKFLFVFFKCTVTGHKQTTTY